MKKIFLLLNQKYTAPVVVLIALACRIVNIMLVSFAGRDKMLLVLQSKNFLEGKGLGIQKYFTDNLDSPVYDFTQLWPPGYSLLLTPFLKIFNYNIYWATTAFDIVFSIALIFIVRKICQQINFPVAATNLMTLITGCFEYPFIGASLPTDTVSLFFMLVGISFALKVVVSKQNSWGLIFLTGFFLFLPCAFRYAYPPIVMSVPAAIFLYGWMAKNKALQWKGFLTGGIAGVMIATLFITLKSYTGEAGYILQTERGYFLENLIHWYPVVPGSLINFPFLSSQAIKITRMSFKDVMLLLEIINAIAIAVAIVAFLVVYWIFLSLGWLSFTYSAQKGFIDNWNYIYEARYYALVIMFLQLGFLSWIFLYNKWEKSFWQKTIISICALVLFVEVSHSIYFQTKVAFNFKEYKSSVYREQDYNYFNKLLSRLEKENPAHEILVAAPGDDFYTYTAAYYGKKGIFDAPKLKQGVPKVKKPSLLIVMLYNEELQDYASLIVNPGVKMIKQIDYSNFYLIELIP